MSWGVSSPACEAAGLPISAIRTSAAHASKVADRRRRDFFGCPSSLIDRPILQRCRLESEFVTAGSAMHTGSQRSPPAYHDPCRSISTTGREYLLNGKPIIKATIDADKVLAWHS